MLYDIFEYMYCVKRFIVKGLADREMNGES